MPEKQSLRSIQRAARRDVFDREGETPAEEVVRVDPAPPVEPTPAPEADPVVTTRLGVSVSAEQMAGVRKAWLRDLDLVEHAAPSMAQWIVRAVAAYLRLSPAQRRRHSERLATLTVGRKVPYSFQVPVTMRGELQEAVRAERAADRPVQASALVREALALAVERSAQRAGLEP